MSRAHSSGEATWAFVTRMEQPLAESPTREGKRTAASRSYGTPQVYLRHMLEGDVPQESDDGVIGIIKLRDPTRWQKGLHKVYFIKVAPDGKD